MTRTPPANDLPVLQDCRVYYLMYFGAIIDDEQNKLHGRTVIITPTEPVLLLRRVSRTGSLLRYFNVTDILGKKINNLSAACDLGCIPGIEEEKNSHTQSQM